MNSLNLGDLASDQKIQNVFPAFGQSIPVGKDGRRLWPTKFKRAMGQRIRLGELSIGQVQRTCQVSNKTAYSWRKNGSRKSPHKPKRTQEQAPVFAEIKVQRGEPLVPPAPPQIVFKRAGCKVLLRLDFPIDQLARLFGAFKRDP